ncbi:hypothetical protein FCM35_KLT03876 [Carex littledalei]|uniref:IMS import disulfide relay-system CHCH-CHCH-like Cx9C domain-containing protein n=1 Tax=Carex littledalei TaxID=544730 RepID=A0A833VA48_9POAL|nr:hypothetical protein FCM35_KLT03876 [Carex littledalei]
MGRKAGGMYINPKKFGGAGKPCRKEMLQFLGCLSLNNKKDDKCTKYKDLLVACAEAQITKSWNLIGQILQCILKFRKAILA